VWLRWVGGTVSRCPQHDESLYPFSVGSHAEQKPGCELTSTKCAL